MGNNILYHPRASLTRSRTRQSLVFPYAAQSLATSATCEKVSIRAAAGITSIWLLLSLSCYSTAVAERQGIDLACLEDWDILVAEGAQLGERQAAQELQHHVALATRFTLPIVNAVTVRIATSFNPCEPPSKPKKKETCHASVLRNDRDASCCVLLCCREA